MGRPPTISRQQILETARAVFEAKGFAATTLADIACELGVTPAAILRHVDSKQDLFAQSMQTGMLVDPPACILELPLIDAASDPCAVLRRIAEEFVPFIQEVLKTRIVVAMHANARSTSLVLPFDPDADNPPRRGLKIVADYFRRAAAAGVMNLDDPQAAAMLFMGSLQGYVLSQTVLKIAPPLSLEQYIDALLALWSGGVIVGGNRARRKTARKNRDRARRSDNRGDRPRSLSRGSEKAEAGRAKRNTRGPDGGSGVARRRPRHPRADR